jgi:uncharacterized damage-inducible protein DinB
MQTKEIAVKMVLSGWKNGQDKIEKALAMLSDDDMDMELMPDGNSVSWVVGHLAAVNDSLLTILGLGEKLNEDYFDYFLNDDSPVKVPTVAQTRDYWRVTIERLNDAMAELSAEDWFDKHTTVSAEDFAKEPHRNRLNVLLSRTYHLNHHYGQLALVLKTITV